MAKKKPAAPPETPAARVTGLVEAQATDLERAAAAVAGETQAIAPVNFTVAARHQRVALLAGAGLGNPEIARRTGYSMQRVATILSEGAHDATFRQWMDAAKEVLAPKMLEAADLALDAEILALAAQVEKLQNKNLVRRLGPEKLAKMAQANATAFRELRVAAFGDQRDDRDDDHTPAGSIPVTPQQLGQLVEAVAAAHRSNAAKATIKADIVRGQP